MNPEHSIIQLTMIKNKFTLFLALTVVLPALATPGLANTAAASSFKSEKDIITREEWGADEDYLFLESNDAIPDLIELDDNFAEIYKDELQIARTATHDSQGRAFKWPTQYPEETTKFIIHHTETTNDLDNPKQAIRNIYHHHAINRGWGDIGYNYLIDQQGRVYEGRYGGEGVVGGHAGPGNIGSIGIAILGSYDDETPSKAATESLARLIAIKAKIHNINPEGYSSFRGGTRANVMGHRDIMSTSCPGDEFYDQLPLLASMAKGMMDETKPKFVKEYDYIDKSNIYYIEMEPSETEKITIKFENIGTTTWDDKTYLSANKNQDHNKVVDFPSKEGVKLAEMKESEVEPGETATFTFTLRSKKKNALIYLDLAPVVNGKKKLSDYKVLPVKVNAPIYTFEVISADLPPQAMSKGEKFEGTIKVKNTGNITWQKKGRNKVFIKENGKIIGELKENEIEKGETGTLTFSWQAPSEHGYYEGDLTPVLKGEGELVRAKGDELTYETVIYKDGFAGELVSTGGHNEMEQGKSYVLWAKLRNIGSETWESSDFDIKYTKQRSLSITNTSLSQKTIEPGETVKINVTVAVSENANPSQKRAFTIIPKISGERIIEERILLKYSTVEDKPLKQEITEKRNEMYAFDPTKKVTEKSLTQDEGGDIRVRISFNENPIITSAEKFYLYNSDGEKLKTLEKGETVELKKIGLKYAANASSESKMYLATEPFQVKASPEKALEITNFSRLSSWNSDYNDNKFRGALEMQTVDGSPAVINELPLEDYLKGLAEEPNSEEYEKIKAIMVAARSYAKFYMHYADKFPGKPYHLNDDPAYCQKYLGYGYELRAPNIVKAVEDTEGEVVTHYDQLIKTPYFSSDDGKTRNALDVWGWDAPYLVSKNDPYCEGGELSGHGVGMSGCGSRGMAKAGYDYEEILEYYYTHTQVTKLW